MSVRFHGQVAELLVPIDQIRQHPRNANNGDVEAIAESILSNGFYNPISVQRSTGYIVAGNHRYAAMLSLGQEQIPAVMLDIDDETALRVMLADNRTAELAVRDEHELQTLLDELAETEQGLAGTAYTDDDLSDLERKMRAIDHMPIEVDEEYEHVSFDVRRKEPQVTVLGYLEEDGHTRKFDKGEVEDAIVRLKDLGFNAVGG